MARGASTSGVCSRTAVVVDSVLRGTMYVCGVKAGLFLPFMAACFRVIARGSSMAYKERVFLTFDVAQTPLFLKC